MRQPLFVFAFVAVAFASDAAAQQSVYSKMTSKTCSLVRKTPPGDGGNLSVSKCPGKFGYLVRVEDFDDRMSVSVGRTMAKAAKEPAAKLSFSSFNDADDVIEWRSRGGKPYAIIQRWVFQRGVDYKREFLVVTRLPPGPVCHIAHVAIAVPDHKNIARGIADKKASLSRCEDSEFEIIDVPQKPDDAEKKPGH